MRFSRSSALIASSLAAIALWFWIIDESQTYSGEKSSPSAAPIYTPKIPKVAVWFGDSYGTGTGATTKSKAFISIVSRTLGLYSENLSQGGSGYLHYGTGKYDVRSVCGTFPYGNYLQALRNNTCLKADYVFVTGGRNDTWNSSLAKQVDTFYASLHARFPHAKIVAISPILGLEAETPSWLQFKNAVRTSVERYGGYYVDLGEPLKRDIRLMWKDRFHPNDAGHYIIAKSIISSLKRRMNF
jgi:lysophospholipase L1-like esterase